jgi:hypothetical protein
VLFGPAMSESIIFLPLTYCFTSLSLCHPPSSTPMATDFEDRLLPIQVVRLIAFRFQVPSR